MRIKSIESIKILSVLLLYVFSCLCPLMANNYEEGSIRFFEEFNITHKEIVVDEKNDSIPSGNNFEHEYDAVLDNVIKEGRVTNKLNKTAFFSLPIGISIGADASYMIVINEATIYNDHAMFSAFMVLTNPLDGSKIRFAANNISFSFKSGLINGFQLELINKKEIHIQEDASLWVLPGSYVEWDCNGFKSLGINGELELNEKHFIKVNPQTGEEQGKVSALFTVVASDFQNMLVELSLDPFKMKGFDEVYFSFENLVFDFSDTRNSAGFSLPKDYPCAFEGEMAGLWRGLYVNKARIYLSKKFAGKNGRVTSFYTQNLILDDYGLSGVMGVNNLLSIEKGKIGNWPMSVDEFELELFTSEVKALTLKGRMIIQGSKSELNYDAFYDASGIYHFGVSPDKELNFNVFAAKVVLDKASVIEVTVDNNRFYPEANLNGKISFTTTKDGNADGKKILEIPSLDFQGLRIATVSPKFDIKYLAVASGDNLSFNNFPITLTEVGCQKINNDAVFKFGIKVNLSPSSDDGIVGETNLGIRTDISGDNWKFKGLSVEGIYVKASKEGAYEIEGSVLFVEGDYTYGDGFRGDLNAKFAKSFDLEAIAVFGKVNGFRYFFVDAFLTLPGTGIPAGPFTLNGFGGGMYYRMRQATDGANGSEFGKSITGLTYIPDKSSYLGIKAGVQGGVVNPKLVSVRANFLINFNSNGGINQISFEGQGTVATPPKVASIAGTKDVMHKAVNKEPQTIASTEIMKASVYILMDFQNDVFHSEMELFLNVAGAIKGVGPNNRAGWGVMHIDSDKWYLHLGTPSDPMGLELMGIVKAGGYFMAGHDIPDAMMMHPKVLEYLNVSDKDFNGNRSEGEIMKGNGIAFGANVELNTGDLTFLIFYARLEMGGGFDVMLIDYGEKAYCEGRNGGVGINGWYGKGQAYAYFGGKIGIKVKVFRRKKKFNILTIQTAAAIRLEGPNPTWMKGVVGGKCSILGGMVKGNCKFEVTVGDKCELRTISDLSDLEIIADLTPADKSNDIDIFTLPQAVFNIPVNKIIQISEGAGLNRTFKVNLAEYSIYKDNEKLNGSTEFDAEKTTLAFTPDRIFDPESEYRIVAKVSFDEFEDGSWQRFKDDSDNVYYETKEVTFKTGQLPDRIPGDYVQYTYPLERQVNFYKKEYGTSYITFKADVEPFFMPGEGWGQKACWRPVNGTPTPIYSDITYLPGKKSVETIVPDELNNGTVYNFELVNIPLDDNNAVNRNVKENIEQTVNDKSGATTEITTREAIGEIRDAEEKAFYSIPFRVSLHNKFLDKLTAKEMNIRFLHNVSPGVDIMGSTAYGSEMFDKFEIKGHGNVKPLMRRVAVMDSADWYRNNIYPLIYEVYPLHPNATISYRDTSYYGIPPIHKIDLWQADYNYVLTDEDIESGQISFNADMSHMIYTLQKTWSADYAHIRNMLANEVGKGLQPDNRITTILNKYPAPQVSVGNYPIKVSYVLPGRNIVTSEKVINLKNNIDVKQVDLIDE